MPVIFVTAHEAAAPDVAAACAAGGVDYLPKPFIPHVVAKVRILFS